MPPVKPVVFVPGFPASELRRRGSGRVVFPPDLDVLADSEKRRRLVELLSDPTADLVAGEPIRAFLGIAKQAESLYDNLRRYHYVTGAANDFFEPVGWDWRKAVDDAVVQQQLAAAITRLSGPQNRKVVVIAHSTGGLVLRRMLEAQPRLAERIEVLAFGVPWAGDVKAVRFLVEGEAIKFLVARLLTAAQVRRIMRAAQAAYDLFPPDPARTTMTSAANVPLNLSVNSAGAQVGLLVDTRWIPNDPEGQAMLARAQSADARLGARTSRLELRDAQGEVAPPPVVNVVGWGVGTDVKSTLRANGDVDLAAPSKEGDATVPLASASWLRGPNVRTFFLPIGVYGTSGIPAPHSRIWDSPPVDDLLDQVLEDEAAVTWVCAAADGDQALDRRQAVTVRVAAQDAQGLALPDARVSFPGVTPTVTRFQGSRRAEVTLPRRSLRPANVGSDQFRFVAIVEWGAGGPDRRRELPLLVRA